MVRTLDSVFVTEKNKAENQPIHLYTIYDYDGGSTNLYFAQYDIDVTFDGQTYTKFPIQHEPISENTSGEIDNVKITVANVSRAIQAYIEAYDWRNKKVDITTVFANQLSDADVKRVDTYYISSYVATDEAVEFTLTSKFNVLSVQLPLRNYMRNYCSWKFKGTECGYSGAETTCARTKVACKALNNYERFGGFPSVPMKRLYV